MSKLKKVFICMLMMFLTFSHLVSADDSKSGLEANQSIKLKSNGIVKYNDREKGVAGKIIVIDPGHGGSDTGAIGSANTREKDVTLAIGLELRKLLENSNAKVIMTRETDKDVYGMFASDNAELQSRVDVANNACADLFISVHIDSFVNDLASGTTTYYYAGASRDEQLARLVQESLVEQLKLSDRGYQEANFYVLRNTDMPSILTEIAFISNPDEEKLLKDSRFIKKAAAGIFKGVEKYFNLPEQY